MELFARHQVDAVLLDYFMPDMSGDAVAEEMRRLKTSQFIFILNAVMLASDLDYRPTSHTHEHS